MVFRQSLKFGVRRSKKMDVEEMAKKATMKDLKEIAKKHDIKLGRCPTKLKIAKLIPKEELEALVNK
jgi:hypothetical protein